MEFHQVVAALYSEQKISDCFREERDNFGNQKYRIEIAKSAAKTISIF